jgi:hypothetical protein
MNLRLPVLLLSTAGMAFAADLDTKPAPRPRLTEAVLRQGTNWAPAKHMANGSLAANGVAQDLTPYPVIGGGHGMVGRSNGPTPMSRPFDLMDGGTFTKFDGKYFSVEPKLQYDEPNAGWDLLKISW